LVHGRTVWRRLSPSNRGNRDSGPSAQLLYRNTPTNRCSWPFGTACFDRRIIAGDVAPAWRRRRNVRLGCACSPADDAADLVRHMGSRTRARHYHGHRDFTDGATNCELAAHETASRLGSGQSTPPFTPNQSADAHIADRRSRHVIAVSTQGREPARVASSPWACPARRSDRWAAHLRTPRPSAAPGLRLRRAVQPPPGTGAGAVFSLVTQSIRRAVQPSSPTSCYAHWPPKSRLRREMSELNSPRSLRGRLPQGHRPSSGRGARS
jgi:hypothetical protein